MRATIDFRPVRREAIHEREKSFNRGGLNEQMCISLKLDLKVAQIQPEQGLNAQYFLSPRRRYSTKDTSKRHR